MPRVISRGIVPPFVKNIKWSVIYNRIKYMRVNPWDESLLRYHGEPIGSVVSGVRWESQE